jgi:hypothetical protein
MMTVIFPVSFAFIPEHKCIEREVTGANQRFHVGNLAGYRDELLMVAVTLLEKVLDRE